MFPACFIATVLAAACLAAFGCNRGSKPAPAPVVKPAAVAANVERGAQVTPPVAAPAVAAVEPDRAQRGAETQKAAVERLQKDLNSLRTSMVKIAQQMHMAEERAWASDPELKRLHAAGTDNHDEYQRALQTLPDYVKLNGQLSETTADYTAVRHMMELAQQGKMDELAAMQSIGKPMQVPRRTGG
jgi:hypothetical protein